MRKQAAFCGVVLLCLTVLVITANGQEDKSKRSSPPAMAELKFADGKTIIVNYSSPRMKGRKIFGDLVPYGQVWRAGANEATTFVTNGDVNVGGKAVPAGSYTLFVIPKADKWTLIISKKTREWGTDYAGVTQDLARVDMKVERLPAAVENFTISLGGASSALEMEWETTRASVVITQ